MSEYMNTWTHERSHLILDFEAHEWKINELGIFDSSSVKVLYLIGEHEFSL